MEGLTTSPNPPPMTPLCSVYPDTLPSLPLLQSHWACLGRRAFALAVSYAKNSLPLNICLANSLTASSFAQLSSSATLYLGYNSPSNLEGTANLLYPLDFPLSTCSPTIFYNSLTMPTVVYLLPLECNLHPRGILRVVCLKQSWP